jgi:hypothetical protein
MSVASRLDTENLKPVSGLEGLTPSENAILSGLLAKFPGSRLRTAEDEAASAAGRDLMYGLGVSPFKMVARGYVANGWSVYPQVNGDGKRKPAIVDGHSIRPSEYLHKRLAGKELDYLTVKAGGANVGILFGPASGNAVGLDIDIGNEREVRWVCGLADRIFGFTPFRRQGREPRMLLIYRQPATAKGDKSRFRKTSRYFDVDGVQSKDGVELLADGSTATAFGFHHSTGGHFVWFGDQPGYSGPEKAPLITADQVDQFWEELNAYRKLHGYGRKVVSHLAPTPVEFDGRVNIPSNKQATGVWEKAGLGKVISGGRQGWIFKRAFDWVRMNGDMARTVEGAAALTARIVDEALRHVERSGKWDDASIRAEAESCAKRTISNLLEDRFMPAVVSIAEDGSRSIPSSGIVSIDGMLGPDGMWLAPAGHRARRKPPATIIPKSDDDHRPDPIKAKSLALLSSTARQDVGQLVSQEVRDAITGWLEALWDAREEIAGIMKDGGSLPEVMAAVRLLKAPTGAGKTTTFVRAIGEIVQRRGPLGFAIAMFMPSHANLSEAKAAAMANSGIDLWDETAAAGQGLKVMQFKGKVLAGCFFGDQVAKLQSAGVAATGMCRQSVWDPIGKEKVEKVCERAAECPAMLQIKLAAEADLILLPHAYLTASLPKGLSKAIGAVIIDERFWAERSKVAKFPLDILRRGRREPFLTKTDHKVGMTVQDYVRERDQAADIAMKALTARGCPAAALADYSRKSVLSGKIVTGLDLVMSAKTVCTRASKASMSVVPGMAMTAVDKLLSEPMGEHLMLEWRFWKIIEERIMAIKAGTAKHAREKRIKLLKPDEDTADIRIAWNVDLNLPGLPTFLLDASANPRIAAKCFPKREVSVTNVEAPLHLRTIVVPASFSNQSLLPAKNKSVKDRTLAAEKLVDVRRIQTRIASLYGNNRLLFGSTLAVETAMNDSFAHIPNVDHVHYGALVGLDAFKNHDVAISVGRLEPPVDVLDGYVAAMSYDEDADEPDWDIDGTGKAGDKPLRAPEGERRIQRRDGAIMTVKASVYPDGYPWHQAIQSQFREEELRQFAGRLRPVYRTDDVAPLWICMASCVPEGIVVDDVVTLRDLVELEQRSGGLMDLVRKNGGVLDTDAGEVFPEICGSIAEQEGALAKLTARELAHFATVKIWTDGKAKPREVRVATWVPDLWRALEASQRRLGRELDRFEIVEFQQPVNPLVMRKPPSKLDRALSALPNAATATMDEILQERADREAMLREAVVDAVHARPPTVPWHWTSLPIADGRTECSSLEVRMLLHKYGAGEDYVAPSPPEIAVAA